jgi:predicted transcriptional regulator
MSNKISNNRPMQRSLEVLLGIRNEIVDIMNNNLYQVYKKEVVPKVMSELGLKNQLQVPKITKVVVNVGSIEAPLTING